MITTIFDLDLSSLQHILSYLNYIDKLKMLLVSKDIAKLAEEIIDNEPFNIVIVQMNFSVEEVKKLLIDCASYVKRLRCTDSFYDETTLAYMKLLLEYCTNLQEIFFSEHEISTTNIYGQILSSAQTTIEILTLENCTVRYPACTLVANLSKLKVLNLPCSTLSGEDFGRLRNLTDLNLRNCKDFNSENFIDILKSNKLVKLNLEGFSLSHSVVDMLLKTQSNLNVLTVGESRYPQICGMESLREISMSRCSKKYVLTYLKEVVDNRAPIESLEIDGTDIHIDIKDWSAIVDQIVQLYYLRIVSFRNIYLANSQLEKIAKFCRKIELLDLYRSNVGDTGIIRCIKYLKHLRHLDVSYCCVTKRLYSGLVATRQELGFVKKLLVYVRPPMKLAAVIKSDEYAYTRTFVQLTPSPMRTARDSSILERLEQLNFAYFSYAGSLNRQVPGPLKPLSSQEPSLLDLDDNSLYHIMQFLPLFGKLKLTLTNSRFENVIKPFLRNNTINLGKFLTLFTSSEAKNLLSRFGYFMRKLSIKPRFFIDLEYYDLLFKYLTNVVELSIFGGLFVEIELYMKLIMNSKDTLEILRIISSDIDGMVSLEISRAPRLHTLILEKSTLTGADFGNLTNLTILNLSSVKNLEPATFIAICKSNRLKILNIRGWNKLNNQSLEVLVDTQTTLEKLVIRWGRPESCNPTNMHLVARLKKLKDLELHLSSSNEFLQCTDALAAFKCDQLQFLAIFCHVDAVDIHIDERLRVLENIATNRNLLYLQMQDCIPLNIDFIRTIAKGCPLLKALQVVNFEENLNDELIHEAITLFKHLRHFGVDDLKCQASPVSSRCIFASMYHKALKIKMNEGGRGPVVLYASSMEDLIKGTVKTREYIINKKYVQLSSKKLHELDKYELVKEETQSPDTAELTQTNSDEVDSLGPNILDISASCLHKIASYLQPIDKLVFASLHKTVLISIQTALDNVLHSLDDIARIFTVSEARDLFAACAGHMKRIKISMTLIDYISLLQPYSLYFTEIDITGRKSYMNEMSQLDEMSEVMQLFGPGDKKLQKLAVRKFQMVEEILKHLTQTSNVRSICSLNVSDCELSGQYIGAFEHITDLNLMNIEVEDKYFQNICHSLKLKRLNIIGIFWLSSFSFDVLVKFQTSHLEQLSMSYRYEAFNYKDVAKLESLRHITIEVKDHNLEFKNLLKALVVYHRKDLEYLKVTSYYRQIFEMVEEMKINFQNLKNIVFKKL